MKKRSSQDLRSRSRRATEPLKLLAVIGTRPEAIKMCPLIKELGVRGAQVRVCLSGQHRELVYEVLSAFSVTPDYDLGIMRESQSLFDITSVLLERMKEALERERPDAVLIHGDTTTAFVTSLVCFYLGIPTAHVEAGLRTGDVRAPFPEEFNRRVISLSAACHLAPTETARDNLLREGIDGSRIFVTGNTVVDAVRQTVRERFSHTLLDGADGKRIIFLTAHRRENIGRLEDMLGAVRRVSEEMEDVLFLYPVHPSPAVGEIAERVLRGARGVRMSPPLGVVDCHNIIARSYLVLTDSGGLQEEAAALGVPVLVMRERTERPEGIEAGIARLVGTDGEGIYTSLVALLDSELERERMRLSPNPYGDGNASVRIAEALTELGF